MSEKKELINTYMAARREWNERYGDYISNAHTWKITAFISIGLAALAVGGMIFSSIKSQVIPYIIEVDKLGNIGAIEKVESGGKMGDETLSYYIKSSLGKFATNLFTVTNDIPLQHRNIRLAYAFIQSHSAAFHGINEYFKSGMSPFYRMNQVLVTVEVKTVLPISKHSWQIEWNEKLRNLKGETVDIKEFKGVANIVFSNPTNEKQILQNPLGLLVQDFSWVEKMGELQ